MSVRIADRRRSGRRRAAAAAHVVCPSRGILVGREIGVRGERYTGGRSGRGRFGVLIKQPLQVVSAPAAARPCTEAVAYLRHAPGPLDPDEIEQFSFGDVKAEANFVVEFHD